MLKASMTTLHTKSLTNCQEFWKKPRMQTIRARSFKRFDGPQGSLDLKISDRKVKLLDGFFKQKNRPSRNELVNFRSTSFLCTKKLKDPSLIISTTTSSS